MSNYLVADIGKNIADKIEEYVFREILPRGSQEGVICLFFEDQSLNWIASKLEVKPEVILNALRSGLGGNATRWKEVIFRNVWGKNGFWTAIYIQILAGYWREGAMGGSKTDRSYYPSLNKLLGIPPDNKNVLSQLFAEIQDALWSKLDCWIKKEGYASNIPSRKWGADRYVQYPKSQVLLTKADLLKFTLVFKKFGLKPREEIILTDFCELLGLSNQSEKYEELPSRVNNIFRLRSEAGRRMAIQQLWAYYDDWDGIVFQKEREKRPALKKKERIEQLLYLELDSNPKLVIRNAESKTIREINLRHLDPSRLNEDILHSIKKKGYLVFLCDPDYGDYLCVRNIKIGDEVAILFYPEGKLDIFRPFDRSPITVGNWEIFKFCLTEVNKVYMPQEALQQELLLPELRFGIKLGHRIWLQGAGPEIQFKNGESRFWLNGEKIEINENSTYSLRKADPGQYLLKVPEASSIRFEIRKKSNVEVAIASSAGYWDIVSWNFGEGFDGRLTLQGMLHPAIDLQNNQNGGIREWLQAAINPQKGRSSQTIVSKALNRRTHG